MRPMRSVAGAVWLALGCSDDERTSATAPPWWTIAMPMIESSEVGTKASTMRPAAPARELGRWDFSAPRKGRTKRFVMIRNTIPAEMKMAAGRPLVNHGIDLPNQSTDHAGACCQASSAAHALRPRTMVPRIIRVMPRSRTNPAQSTKMASAAEPRLISGREVMVSCTRTESPEKRPERKRNGRRWVSEFETKRVSA